ncbi:TRAP transporter small permease [Motiliproteus coralliicola]|uniref:TRAP transporter small permease protein n=1 Tax=Motiliproteus coralliicola TaxID=2283196 RepID=A0A369WC96_9GAMM|nr:TRAP transporter small permease [Motiliproteus coralliicola]RDE18951.1 TRAP transporter small permease [Motiliproteus coralliicola]
MNSINSHVAKPDRSGSTTHSVGGRLARGLRKGLDALYLGCGGLAALFLLAILVIIVAQMACRWLGLQFPGSSAYAGYCMAASSFFALAYTLNQNAHIRVTLFIQGLRRSTRRLADIWCLSVALFLAGYLAYYACKNVYISHLLHDISQGQDATPLWIPQLSVAIGSVVFAIALADHLVRTLWRRDHTFDEDHHVEGEEF